MKKSHKPFLPVALLLSISSLVFAEDDPGHERHELMEGVRDAAKPVGGMLRGKQDFDAARLRQSLDVFAAAGEKVGDLFPEGSQGGEAAPAIWEDRDGFEAALAKWRDATAAAQAARPTTLEEARPVVMPVMGACKNCHDTYRIEDEE
jgi:cytochrome c556